jgi:23S rRNA pseudouridine955/2504/2580 synthase
LHTGRTHQIRVHAAYRQHPIAGDDRYGDPDFNKKMRQLGLKRMFLHAERIEFVLPSSKDHIRISAPLDAELEDCLAALTKRA